LFVHDYPATDPAAPTLIFGHGAGAGHEHPWIVKVAKGLGDRGVRVVTFNFPYRAEGRKLPDKPAVLEAAFQAVWTGVIAADRDSGRSGGCYFAGGKSMGARISSQAAAAGGFSPAPAGLVFFGYPLHPPAKPDQRRDRHLPKVAAPMLFLHGTRDPFGSADEMRALAEALPGASLEIIPGGDHSLAASKRDDPDRRSLDRAMDLAAEWIRRTAAA
jgi:predicted alpha/beta-hydrolase family hydrolase